MHTTRLFNVIVVGGFSLGGCSNEAPGSPTEAEDSGSGGVTGQTGSGGSEQVDVPGNAGAPDGSAEPGDASDGAPPREASLSCTCTEPPIIHCDGVCCMWMFQQDQPCCDKL